MSGKNVEELMELNDSLLANIKLLTEHIEFAETIISTAAAALDASGAQTNGADGYGKRQELSMAQRINWLVNKIVHLEKKLAVAVAEAGHNGYLNPQFVEVLMGYDIGITGLRFLETVWFRKRRRKRSAN